MKIFIQSIVAQILLNPYIFWRGYQAIPPKKSWRIPYILFLSLNYLSSSSALHSAMSCRTPS